MNESRPDRDDLSSANIAIIVSEQNSLPLSKMVSSKRENPFLKSNQNVVLDAILII